jgi:hypothetical protein
MNQFLKKTVFIWGLTLLISAVAIAQQTEAEKEAAYTKVVTERAGKIVAVLGVTDQKKSDKVRDIIADQYKNLNTIHDKRNAAIKALKSQANQNPNSKEDIKKLEDDAMLKLSKLHKKYLKKLSKELSGDQIEMVKDGMTYRVLPITYKGYQEMLPNLSTEQKKQILAYLTDAREFAMDAESSEKKHGWFGKYKGRINNYLSAQGINMKEASIEWQNRIKAAEEAKKQKAQVN